MALLSQPHKGTASRGVGPSYFTHSSALQIWRRHLPQPQDRRPESKARLVALDAAPEEQALAALSDARDALLELDDIAGRLARSAYEHGASWKDIGSSLGTSANSAQQFFERRRER